MARSFTLSRHNNSLRTEKNDFSNFVKIIISEFDFTSFDPNLILNIKGGEFFLPENGYPELQFNRSSDTKEGGAGGFSVFSPF